MFTPERYRAQAIEYAALATKAGGPAERQDCHELERIFNVLADNEQWLSDNYNRALNAGEDRTESDVTLAVNEERILRYLGAALIMQWNSLPTKLRRELFDNAGAMGELLDTAVLRGQIARFLHKHKDGEDQVIEPPR